jgi:hypothetical protein
MAILYIKDSDINKIYINLNSETEITFSSVSAMAKICRMKKGDDIIILHNTGDGATVLEGCEVGNIILKSITIYSKGYNIFDKSEYRKYKISKLDL